MVIKINLITKIYEINFALLGIFLFIETFHVPLIYWKHDALHADFYTYKVENSEGTTKLCHSFEFSWAEFWVILSQFYETALKLYKGFIKNVSGIKPLSEILLSSVSKCTFLWNKCLSNDILLHIWTTPSSSTLLRTFVPSVPVQESSPSALGSQNYFVLHGKRKQDCSDWSLTFRWQISHCTEWDISI